ncbi:prepilin peptidase [Hirschia litorea]|uniref:Prepilin peptidase n=1 Tax=Hirschia litorea TaxID=1199156 RepID=A0ABW2IH85_9PROT
MLARLKLKSPLHSVLAVGLALIAIFSAFVVLPLDLLVPSICISILLIWASLIDIEHHILPNVLTYALIGMGAAWVSVFRFENLHHHLIGLVAGYAILRIVDVVHVKRTGQHGMGMGDAKLLGAAGMWLGWVAIPTTLLVGAVSGLLFVGFKSLREGRVRRDIRIAFGPHIALGFWWVWLCGPFGQMSL